MPILPLPDRYRVKRPVTRRRVVAMLIGVAVVVGAALLLQGQDTSESSFPVLSATPRSPLEARLLDGTFGMCADGPDVGGCADFEATAAACAARSVTIDGRRWHRCRVRYAADPPTGPAS